ncbi:hypothetical protein CF319_g5059 [Tilletia indica]|nr:hypothetical protein CF319_g5059 [Tilletia indica]
MATHRSSGSGSGALPRRRSGGSSASLSGQHRHTMTSLTPAAPAPRRGIPPPPKKPVKFTMGGDDEDEDTESDEWSEDEKSGMADRIVASPEDAPRITDKSPSLKGKEKGEDELLQQAEGSQAGADNDDEDEWSSDEPTEEEVRRETQAKAEKERERRRKEEEKRQRELFQKVEVPIRSASAADMTQLGRFGMSKLSNVNQQPGAMGPPLAPPTRSLLSSVFNSEEEYAIRAFHRSRMMGNHAEAEQVRKAQIAAHASQPHLPQHAHEQARAHAHAHAHAQLQAQAQSKARSDARSESTMPSQTQARAQSRSRAPRKETPTEGNLPRRSPSIISNSGMDRGILRTSKSAVALPLLTQLELKSSTSQGNANGASSSSLRRTPSDAGSGSVGSGSQWGEKGGDPILRVESAVKDEDFSESVPKLRKNGLASGQKTPTAADTGSSHPSLRPATAMLERSKSMERRDSVGPMPAPSVASHRHSSVALNQLGDGRYQNGYDFMLPAGAFAQTPRTTRRNMLRDELSESVRANLLWERQSRSRRMGSTSGASGAAAPAHIANQQRIAQISRPASTGGIGGAGNGGPSAPADAGPVQNHKSGGRPGQKNSVLSGDRLRPLTSSSSSYTTSPTEQYPRRPGLGPSGPNTRTNSDNGPGSGGNSSDEELHSDGARRRHTYDYNNSFHHKGW